MDINQDNFLPDYNHTYWGYYFFVILAFYSNSFIEDLDICTQNSFKNYWMGANAFVYK